MSGTQAAAPKAMIAVDQANKGLVFKNIDEAYRFAEAAVAGKLVPAGDTAAAVVVKMQAGWELGITPMRALQNLVVFNGRLSMREMLATALVRSSGKMAKGSQFEVWFTGDEDLKTGALADNYTCHVRSQRSDESEPHETTFSVLDAKIARLWNKAQANGVSPWVAYPKRMLLARCKQHHIQDNYSDVTLGIATYETVLDDEPLAGRSTHTAATTVRGNAAVEQPTPKSGSGETDPLFDEPALIDAEVVEPQTENEPPPVVNDDGVVEE